MPILLVALALITAFGSPAIAGPKEEALQVVEQWTDAFTTSDVDGIVKLYAPDALFLGTGSKTVVTKPEELRQYFEQVFRSLKSPGAKVGDQAGVVVSDTVVVVTGLDTVTGVREWHAHQRQWPRHLCHRETWLRLANRAFPSLGPAELTSRTAYAPVQMVAHA